jgi:hypothetical protein
VNSAKCSLREAVEHWLATDPANGLRVTEFRRTNHKCYVCVETLTAGGPIALYFFRHQDGAWRIFPPRREWPAMRATSYSMNF